MSIPDRDLRQRDLVPPERLSICRATVVGVGAIGRQVALQLAAMGIPSLKLIDPDTVEPVNLSTQGYAESDLGRTKVEATSIACSRINSGATIEPVPERFRRSSEPGNVVFCCVDRIATRRFVWNCCRDRVDFFADGRMSSEVLRVLASADLESRRYYPTTLFDQSEAYSGSCTARSTIYSASIAAGLMLSQFSRWLRRLPVEPDLVLNLLASELAVGAPAPCTR